jgi:hypothetical protein
MEQKIIHELQMKYRNCAKFHGSATKSAMNLIRTGSQTDGAA